MELASELERRWMAPLRGAQWRGRLTLDQYVGRNRRIYSSHPFGSQIQTFLLKERNEICASFDALTLRFLAKTTNEGIRELNGIHVASVLTPPEKRGHGYGKRLLSEYFAAHPKQVAYLNSGIGTSYYAAMGFRVEPTPAMVKEVPITAPNGKSALAISLSLETFGERLRAERRAMLEAEEYVSGILPFPTDVYLDWHLERYRYFAEVMGQESPRNMFWALGNEIVATIPDFAQSQLDCFWLPKKTSLALDFAQTLARDWKLDRVRYVERQAPLDPKQADIPMLRFPECADAKLVDTQLCDVW